MHWCLVLLSAEWDCTVVYISVTNPSHSDLADGQLWNASASGYNALGPVVGEGKVFVSGAMDTLYAFHAKTGKLAWAAGNLAANHLWSVPAVANGTVYVGSDEDAILHALDAATGKHSWVFHAEDAVRTPVVSDGMIFFGANSPFGPGSASQFYALLQ